MKVSNHLLKNVLDKKKKKKKNLLPEEPYGRKWKKRQEDFPKLSHSHLRDLTLGIYQIKQAKSYTQEHVSAKGKYEFNIHKEEAGLIHVRIQSCHSSSKSYLLGDGRVV